MASHNGKDKASSKQRMNILSLDGGGIRGIVSALWLRELEKELKTDLRKNFDLIAGTSTGSILASALALEIPLEQIIELYSQKGREVFPSGLKRRWGKFSRLFSDGVSSPKYDGEGLEKELKRVFGDARFGDLTVNTLVVTYDCYNRAPLVFKSWQKDFANLNLWEVVRASCSAPTYFPGAIMELKGQRLPLIDGGVAANNPAACAIAEAIRLTRSNNERVEISDFLLASFGTGELTRPISEEDVGEWGAAEWAIPIIDVLMDASADTSDYIADKIITAGNYFRFQTRLVEGFDDMDDASHTNIQGLVRTASRYLRSQEGDAMLKKLVQALKSR